MLLARESPSSLYLEKGLAVSKKKVLFGQWNRKLDHEIFNPGEINAGSEFRSYFENFTLHLCQPLN